MEWLLIRLSSKKNKLSKIRISIIVIAFILFVVVFNEDIISRFQSLGDAQDPQFDNRFTHYIMAWEFIKQNPLIGYGLNNCAYVTPELFLPVNIFIDSFFYENPAHNMYLLLWFEGGLFFLLSFLWMFWSGITQVIINVKNNNPIQIGIFGSLMTVLMYGFVGWGLFSGTQMMYVLYIILALLFVVNINKIAV
jgi:O-antigen ligase